MRLKTTLITLIVCAVSIAQTASVEGTLIDASSRLSIPFANIVVEGTTIGGATDLDGVFRIDGIAPGYIKLDVSVIGYERKLTEDIYVIPSKTAFIEIALQPSVSQLDEVVVTTSKFRETKESPVSLQTLGIEEIERNPGGGRDVSRAIQSLPGVAAFPGFRNDIVIRGGAPNENRFYIDGIETPLINHFQTQGSSGGPVGMLNINLLKEVNLYSGAFPANRGNALSSVLEFEQRNGSKEQVGFRGTIGSSDLALTVDGPISEKTTFIASYRLSYLQFLFQVLGLPFLPEYQDAQFKVNTRIDERNEISFIGLGAIDDFTLDTLVNEGVSDPETIDQNNYILGNIPVNDQRNYTVGTVYKHYADKGFWTAVVSRNALLNNATKFEGNDESDEAKKLLEYTSTEVENKFRLEHTRIYNGNRWNVGVNLESAHYTNETFNRFGTSQGEQVKEFKSTLDFMKWGLFGQWSRSFFDETLDVSAGFRVDANDYSEEMEDAIEQLSPRFSLAYNFLPQWSFNLNVGRYFQLPAYTVLGYRDAEGRLANQPRTDFIRSDHYVAGLKWLPNESSKLTVEGFFKDYSDYPFLLRDSISLANLGADFGVVGNDATTSINEGRAYGVEFLAQRRAKNGIYGILAYTFVRSEFEDKNGELRASSWDSRHFVTLTSGKKFKKNWELGIRYRYAGGLPFTPYDVPTSSLIENWTVNGRAVPDFNRLNSQRLNAFNQLDVRIDKTWYSEKVSINLFLDIENILNVTADAVEELTVATDEAGNILLDPQDPSRYSLRPLAQDGGGTIIPTIGVIVDF